MVKEISVQHASVFVFFFRCVVKYELIRTENQKSCKPKKKSQPNFSDTLKDHVNWTVCYARYTIFA